MTFCHSWATHFARAYTVRAYVRARSALVPRAARTFWRSRVRGALPAVACAHALSSHRRAPRLSGTNTRLQLYQAVVGAAARAGSKAPGALVLEKQYLNSEHEGFMSILKLFLQEAGEDAGSRVARSHLPPPPSALRAATLPRKGEVGTQRCKRGARVARRLRRRRARRRLLRSCRPCLGQHGARRCARPKLPAPLRGTPHTGLAVTTHRVPRSLRNRVACLALLLRRSSGSPAAALLACFPFPHH
eukprot:891322-Pleurochrysis_carterae.AAC.1